MSIDPEMVLYALQATDFRHELAPVVPLIDYRVPRESILAKALGCVICC